MSVEVRPLGVRCNLQCHYCYQHPQRDAGNSAGPYHLPLMKEAIAAGGGPFALFGGEPLLVPQEDLESLLAWGFEKYGSSSIQTNGTLMGDAHIRMFKAYKVMVGVSIDGPGALNDARWQGTLEKTRAATAKTEQAIARLCQEGLTPHLIVTLHRGNASADKLPSLVEWFFALERMGIRMVRLHLLERDHGGDRVDYALGIDENVATLLALSAIERRLGRLSFDLFADMRRLLLGQDKNTACVWNACDPYTTPAVHGVEGRGQRSNCGRTNKDGIDFIKSGKGGYERCLALHATPQEAGGCGDCRFFLMCKGQCPGTAIDGDWRNRSEHCEIWKAVFAGLESEVLAAGGTPLSLRADRKDIEASFLEVCTRHCC